MDILSLKACDIMVRNVITVRASDTLLALTQIMEKRRITGLPVVDEAGKLQGVVSQTDVIRAYSKQGPAAEGTREFFKDTGDEKQRLAELASAMSGAAGLASQKVEDIMTRETFVIPENMPVKLIAQTMLAKKMHRLIVIDDDMNLSGIVATMDLIKILAEYEA